MYMFEYAVSGTADFFALHGVIGKWWFQMTLPHLTFLADCKTKEKQPLNFLSSLDIHCIRMRWSKVSATSYAKFMQRVIISDVFFRKLHCKIAADTPADALYVHFNIPAPYIHTLSSFRTPSIHHAAFPHLHFFPLQEVKRSLECPIATIVSQTLRYKWENTLILKLTGYHIRHTCKLNVLL